MMNLLHVLASTSEVVNDGIQIQEILLKILFYDLCCIVFYLVQFGGSYIERKNMHGVHNMRICIVQMQY